MNHRLSPVHMTVHVHIPVGNRLPSPILKILIDFSLPPSVTLTEKHTKCKGHQVSGIPTLETATIVIMVVVMAQKTQY
jgi:hypothetical protein